MTSITHHHITLIHSHLQRFKSRDETCDTFLHFQSRRFSYYSWQSPFYISPRIQLKSKLSLCPLVIFYILVNSKVNPMIVAFLIGGILILCGILIKIYPNLIAGYNTMSKEEKKNVDIDGLSSFMCWSLIILGIIIAGGQILFYWLKKDFTLYPYLIPIIGCIIIVIRAQKYDHNK